VVGDGAARTMHASVRRRAQCMATLQVSVEELAEHMEAIRAKHPGDGLLLLQLMAAWLSRAFATVSFDLRAELIAASATQQPWASITGPLQDALLQCALCSSREPERSACMHAACACASAPCTLKPGCCCCRHARECDADAGAMFIARVCEQSFAALPEQGAAPSDVAEVLVLSAACRAVPLALAKASSALCPLRSKLLSPGRVSLALWLLAQVCPASRDAWRARHLGRAFPVLSGRAR
jgi:hypothetical protein